MQQDVRMKVVLINFIFAGMTVKRPHCYVYCIGSYLLLELIRITRGCRGPHGYQNTTTNGLHALLYRSITPAPFVDIVNLPW